MRLLLIILIGFIGSGCSKLVKPTIEQSRVQIIQPVQDTVPIRDIMPTPESISSKPVEIKEPEGFNKYLNEYDKYTVVKGDCLWNIAKNPKIYDNPWLWPLIYGANRADIDTPDLIYPKQVFRILRLPSDIQIDNAIKEAERY